MTPIALLLTSFALLASFVVTALPLSPRSTFDQAYIVFSFDNVNHESPHIGLTDTIYVRYELSRILGRCGATATTPNTTVTAFHAFNSKTPLTTTLLSTSSSINNPYITIPPGSGAGELSFWFSCTMNGSEPVWDSDYGKNFKFTVFGGMVEFQKDSKITVSGEIKAGEPVGITYDVARSPCVVKKDDPVHSVEAHWMFNNQVGDTHSGKGLVYNSRWVTRNGLVTNVYNVTIPATTVVEGELQVFFSCQTSLGGGWDSDFGKNWRFQVKA
ncbi:hypothetical protein HDU67_002066 [Dinochytrium kinnereticum]|nr:hypothetical protein HDU67_002066 [Dinochytrium kinnereticum]